MEELKHMQVYDLAGNHQEHKGVYLGQYGPCSKHYNYEHLILINKRIIDPVDISKSFNSSSLLRFKEYSFNLEGKLILKNFVSVIAPKFQKEFYNNILETKLINPQENTSAQSL